MHLGRLHAVGPYAMPAPLNAEPDTYDGRLRALIPPIRCNGLADRATVKSSLQLEARPSTRSCYSNRASTTQTDLRRGLVCQARRGVSAPLAAHVGEQRATWNSNRRP